MNICAPCLSPQLRGLVNQVLREERAYRYAIDPRVLARRIRIESASLALEGSGMHAAERELLRVHRSELARLLRTASVLRAATAAAGASHARQFSLEEWSACLREQLDCIALDDAQLSNDLTHLLARCLGSDIEGWPTAVELARAALALHDIEAGRVAFGRALLAAGHAHAAARLFADALARPIRSSNFGPLLDGLIEAQRRLGDFERAGFLAMHWAQDASEVAN